MNPEDVFDRALREGRGHRSARSVQALLDLAAEVTDALAASRLSRDDRDRIYARSLAMLESAVDEQRRGWERVLRARRPVPILVGGAAALTLGAAALGWALLHGRRGHGVVTA